MRTLDDIEAEMRAQAGSGSTPKLAPAAAPGRPLTLEEVEAEMLSRARAPPQQQPPAHAFQQQQPGFPPAGAPFPPPPMPNQQSNHFPPLGHPGFPPQGFPQQPQFQQPRPQSGQGHAQGFPQGMMPPRGPPGMSMPPMGMPPGMMGPGGPNMGGGVPAPGMMMLPGGVGTLFPPLPSQMHMLGRSLWRPSRFLRHVL